MLNALKKRYIKYGYKRIGKKGLSFGYKLVDRTPSNILRHVVDELNQLPENSKVLNLGCGDGNLEHTVGADRPYSFTSIDIDETAITRLDDIFKQQNHTDDITHIGDITQLDNLFPSSTSFDAIVSWRVLHGILPEYHNEIFQNIYKLLKDGGNLMISVACYRDWKVTALGKRYTPGGINDCAQIMFHAFNIPRDLPFLIHFFNKKELQELGERNGFLLQETSYFQEPSGYTHLKDQPNTYIYATFIKKSSV